MIFGAVGHRVEDLEGELGFDLLVLEGVFDDTQALHADAMHVFVGGIALLAPFVMVWATLGISTTVLLEATLSFLGIGVRPPTPSWGNIIFENQTYFSTAPWLVFIPGAAIILLALAFNFLGDALRDELDPTQRGRQ